MNLFTQPILVVDAETSSPVDLKAQGMYRYFAHPGTKTLMVGAQFLHDPASLYVTDFEVGQSFPQWLRRSHVHRSKISLYMR